VELEAILVWKLINRNKTLTLKNMKKIVATLSIIGAVATSFGQGFILSANSSGSQNVTTNNILDVTGASFGGSSSGLVTGSGGAPQGYYYMLLMLPYAGGATNNPTSLSSLVSGGWLSGWTGAYATNALGAGRLGGLSSSTATPQNDTIGSANQFLVVGWSAGLGLGNPNNLTSGSSWMSISNLIVNLSTGGSSAVAGYLGWSIIGTGVGQPNTSPEQIFGGATGIQSPFTLYAVPVPEPTTIALAGLGGISLLLFRRRKV
jgi:hypothetical protein